MPKSDMKEFDGLGPGVMLSQSDPGGYDDKDRWWVWLDVELGGNGLIYTGATVAEACRKFENQEGGVDHP